MLIESATWAVQALGLWLATGLVVALVFFSWAFGRVEPAGRGVSIGLRLLLIPGGAVLWPVLLWRWRRGLPKTDGGQP
jgi:hypothetical protein